MGQYFHPIILKKNWKLSNKPVYSTFSSYDFDNGAKLMEHSYVHNSLVSAVCYVLANYEYGKPFVWCGDYADEVKTSKGEKDLYTESYELLDKDYNPKEVYGIPEDVYEQEWKYLVNLTKKEYCKIPTYKKGEWAVHPLPLLTCNSNGCGGGDYCLVTDDYDYRKDKRIGSWAYDRIGVTNDDEEIMGFKEIDGTFMDY